MAEEVWKATDATTVKLTDLLRSYDPTIRIGPFLDMVRYRVSKEIEIATANMTNETAKQRAAMSCIEFEVEAHLPALIREYKDIYGNEIGVMDSSAHDERVRELEIRAAEALGLEIETIPEIDQIKDNGMTSLVEIIMSPGDQVEEVRRLVEELGADVNAACRKKRPLTIAKELNRSKIAEFLENQGASE